MPVDYQFKKGIDLPQWVWLQQHPVSSTVSCAMKYDGSRYIYVAQSTTLYRYDTWTNGWQNIQAPTTGGAGQDMIYDSVRNVLILIHGLSLTSWQVFNLNTTAVVIANVTCQPWVWTTMTPILPAAAATGSSLTRHGEWSEGENVLSATAGATGQTTTNIAANADVFNAYMVGLQVRVTSGANTGTTRNISARPNASNITLDTAMAGVLAAGDTFVIERPGGTATGGTTTTLTDTNRAWITNKYTNWDVEIISGTGAGQRRRIASNTATALTLAAAVTGNPRTGPFTTAPATNSVYRIVPSTDFIFYQVGGATAFWRLDIVASPAGAWTAMTAAPATTGAGASADFSRLVAPGHIFLVRAVATTTVYVYDIGLNTWSTLTHFPPPLETLTTGASNILIPSKNKLAIYKDLSQRVAAIDLATGLWETMGNHPYIAGTAVEGKRVEYVVTPDGVEWLYLLRAGGQEWWRVALEWLA